MSNGHVLRAGAVEHGSALESLVDVALDLPVNRRSAFLARACGDDISLRDAAQVWLDACEHDDGTLSGPPIAPVAMLADQAMRDDLVDDTHDPTELADVGRDVGRIVGRGAGAAAVVGDADDTIFPTALSARDDAPAPVSGARVGVWRLLGEIGRGGMGAVYLAERVDIELPLRAALKFMHRAIAFDAVGVRRFRDERRILAALGHPAIARLLDAGVDGGLPWFAMEHVHGAPIDRWCDAHALSIADRIALFCRVCEAVQHAHAQLIVHRDLKPANILITEQGDPKLLDFGIAKLLDDSDLADRSGADAALTRPGTSPMTFAYAAPEQQRGDAPSTAGDIYSLGVLLHVLLVGTLPSSSGKLDLSTAQRDVASVRGTTPVRLRRQLRGDLETIVARAMHAEPARRYPTADALAADLRRYLEGQPVLARPDTVSYRARKFLSRHPAGSALGAISLALILTFGVTAGVQSNRLGMQARELQAQATRLTAERDKATEVTAFLTGVLSSADPYAAPGVVPTLRDVLDRGAQRAESSLQDRPEIRAHLLSAIAPAYFGLGDWDRAGALAAEAVEIRRRTLGPWHSELAASLIYLGSVRVNQNQPRESETHAREALAIIAHNGNRAATDRISALNVLANALQKQGKLAEAESVTRGLLAVERDRTPLDSLRLAGVSRNLAHVLRDRSDAVGALPLYQQAYDLHRGHFGDDHPETANSAVNLGAAYFKVGQAAVAESLLRIGVTTKRRLLGITHRDVAGDQLALSKVLAARGARAEAARLRVEAERVLQGVRQPR